MDAHALPLATTQEQSSEDDEQEDEQEDAWLAHEVARLDAEPVDADAYHPQLMDARAMHSLRAELRTSEARVQSHGHMREFTPRKPMLSRRPFTQARRRRVHRRRPVTAMAAGESDTSDPFVVQDESNTKREYAAALRDEVEQLRALAEQYDDMKHMLLDHLDTICSTKPTERTNSHEVYEKLDALLVFAAQCAQ